MKKMMKVVVLSIIGAIGMAIMLYTIFNEVFSGLTAISITILSLIVILIIDYVLLRKNYDLEFLIISSVVLIIFFAIIGLKYSPAIGLLLLLPFTMSVFSIYMAVESFMKLAGKIEETTE